MSLLRPANGGKQKPQLRRKSLEFVLSRESAVNVWRGWRRREHGAQRAQFAQHRAVARLIRFAGRSFGPRGARLFDAKDFARRGHSYTPRQPRIRRLMSGSYEERGRSWRRASITKRLTAGMVLYTK